MAEGSEPSHIHKLLSHLRGSELTMGLSLCGAGAGGFGVVILRRGKQRQDLELCLRNYFHANANPIKGDDNQSSSTTSSSSSNDDDDVDQELESSMTIHTVMIDPRGISTQSFPSQPVTTTTTTTSATTASANQTDDGGVMIVPPLEDYLFRE